MIIPSWAKWAAGGVLAVILFAILIWVIWPDDSKTVSAQSQQATQSTQAIATAASNAIDIMQQQTANDKNIDDAVEAAKGNIRDAKTVEAIKQSVTSTLCKRAAYRDDPACRLP